MANHTRNGRNGDGEITNAGNAGAADNAGRADNAAKRANLLASAQAASRRVAGAQGAPSHARGAGAGADGKARGSTQGDVSANGPGSNSGGNSDGSAGRRSGRRLASRREAVGVEGAPSHARGGASARGRQTLGGFVKRNSTYILSVVTVVALMTVLVVLVRYFMLGAQGQAGGEGAVAGGEAALATEAGGAGDGAEAGGAEGTGGLIEAVYDWSCLDWSGRWPAYVVGGQVKSHIGVDVSEYQGDIDWEQVATDGIEFAMVRLGYRGATKGELFLDACFEANLEGAQAAGLDCGVYFFSQAQNAKEAVEEAEFVLDSLKGASLVYPVAFDSEDGALGVEESRVSNLSREEMTAVALAFCERVEQAGYRTILYGNWRDLSRLNYEEMGGRHVWWAEYDVATPLEHGGMRMWQYANDGQVAGIGTLADMNIDLSGALE